MDFQQGFPHCRVILVVLAMLAISACGNVRYTPGTDIASNNKFSAPDDSLDRVPQGTKPDVDGDGLGDKLEEEIGTDPFNPDTDGDGVSDGEEYYDLKTDPLNQDSDQGGVSDGQEKLDGTNPLDGTDDLVTSPKPVDPTPIDEDNTPSDPGDGNSDGSDNGNNNDGGGNGGGGSNPSKPQEEPPPASCSQAQIYRAFAEGSGIQREFLPFAGSYSAEENYNYTSTSAYPLIGPTPEDNVLFVYLYQSPDGVSLFFHMNADQAPDTNVEHTDMNIRITTDGTEPQLIFGDEGYHIRFRDGAYEFRSRHYKNSDGAVLGYLDGNFEIEIDIIDSTNTDTVVLATNSGDNLVGQVLLAEDLTNSPVTIRIQGESCEP